MSKHRTKGCLLVCILTIVLMTTTVQAVNEVSYIKGSGIIKYEKADWDTKPVDPENPEDEVEPGGEIVSSKGPLRFDMLPTINFGSQLLSQENQKYYAFAQLFKSNTPARGNYIQITDNRGTLAGWQLSVKQEHQFKNNTTKHKELNGAILFLINNGQIQPLIQNISQQLSKMPSKSNKWELRIQSLLLKKVKDQEHGPLNLDHPGQ